MSLYCARVKLQNLAENKIERWGKEDTEIQVICSVLECLPLPPDIRKDYKHYYDSDKEEQEVKWEAKELTLSCYYGENVFKRIKFLTPANLTGNLIVIYDAGLNLFGIWREEEWQQRDKETTSITIRTSDYKEINLTKLEIDNSFERMERLEQESKLLGKKNLGKRVKKYWTYLKGQLIEQLNKSKEIKRALPRIWQEAVNINDKDRIKRLMEFLGTGIRFSEAEDESE